MYDTGITSIVTLQYWYFQYCEYYNTGNTSIVNITILVIPVSRPVASYYPGKSVKIQVKLIFEAFLDLLRRQFILLQQS
jgi:hypothetical protein